MIKYIILFILFLNTNYGYAQKISNISKYYDSTDTNKHIIHFKAGKSSFAFTAGRDEPDSTSTLFIGNKYKMICKKDSMFMLEVYDGKFLLVSFYPIIDSRLAYGAEFRPKDRVMIIDLNSPEKKWFYFFKRRIKSRDIQKFDSTSGEISIVQRYTVKPG